MTEAVPATGSQLEALGLGSFDLERVLGSGGAGVVWRAVHRTEGVAVAVKVLHARFASHPRVRAAFAQEARALARLDHPSIAAIFDLGEVDPATSAASGGDLPAGAPWFAMELASGGSLDRPEHVPTRWEDLAALLDTLLDALAHGHARGILHRDLKPANVLVRGPGDPRPGGVVLADYGLASVVGAAPTPGTENAGTFAYAAPEQVVGEWRLFGPWTDLYALGATAWSLLAGGPPRGRPFASPYRIPPALEGWLARMLARDPDERFRSANEAREALPGAARRARPRRWPREAPFVAAGLPLFDLRVPKVIGRQEERQRLRAALHAVTVAGTPRVVALTGPSGVGRSTLLRWVAEDALERDRAQVFAVRAVGEGRAIEEALRDWLAFRDGDPTEMLDPISDALGEDLARRIRRALGGAPAPADELVEVAVAVVIRAARRRAVLLAVDDADAQPETGRLVRALRALEVPVLAVVVGGGDAFAVPDVEITVGALPARRIARMLDVLLDLEPDTALRIGQAAHGRVAHGRAILANHVRAGDLVRTGVRWRLPPEVELGAGGVAEAIGPILADAGGDEAEVPFALFAALGPVVPDERWERALALARVSSERGGRVVRALVAAGLVVRRGGASEHRRPTFRAAVLDRAGRHGLASLVHGTCAAVLDEPGAGPSRRLAVGAHLRAAGRIAEAEGVLRESVEGLENADRWELALEAIAELEACTAIGSEAWTWCRRHRLQALSHCGSTARVAEEAEALFRQAVDRGDRLTAGDAARMRALAALHLGRSDQAVAWSREAVERAAGTRIEGGALHMLLVSLDERTAPEEHREITARVLAWVRARGDQPLLASTLSSLATGALMSGDYARARALAGQALGHAASDRATASAARLVLGDAARAGGDLVEAERRYREVVASASPLDEGGAELALAWVNLAVMALERSDPAEAARCLAALEDLFGVVPRLVRPIAELVTAACAAAVGDWVEARSRLGRLGPPLAEPSVVQGDSVVLLAGIRDRAGAAGQLELQALAALHETAIRGATGPR